LELRTTMGQLTGDIQKDMKMLMNFVFNQTEEMRYLMDNLDVTNFNDLGLARYENGRMQIYTKELNLRTEKLTAEFKAADEQTKTTLEASIGGLRTEVEEEIEGLGQWVSSVEQTASKIQTTVTSQGNTLNTHTNNISALQGTTVSLQSQITQTSNKISAVVSAVDDSSGNVTAASIVAAINAAGSSVKISADHVNISGFVTISDLSGNGTVQINAGNIMAGGTISGVALESQAGTQSVTIANGNITFPNGSITNARGYGFTIESTTDMYIGSDSDVYVTTGGAFRIYMRNGKYFEFYGGALTYNESWGQMISQAIFQ